MDYIIEHIIRRSRTVLLILAFLLIAGAYSYVQMPKEAQPDVKIPIIYVSMTHRGISPEDAERLLVRPMEVELRSIEGVKEMTAAAREGSASVTLEFEAGFNSQKALADVRAKVDVVRPNLPEETDEPAVNEVSFALFPVLVVGLAGDIPERTLFHIARELKEQLEGIPQVLEVDVVGDRDDLLEIVLDRDKFETYGLHLDEFLALVKNNNKLVAAGALDSGSGRILVKVPGLFETPEDLLNTPVKVVEDRVIHVKDIATVRKGFVDPTGFARVGGKPALAIEVKKRAGENVIETIEAVRAVVAKSSADWPEALEVSYFQDKSGRIRDMLQDLQNNLISAILLVILVIVVSMGFPAAGLVGLAIPGSFLAGLFILNLMGLTINIVVLFSLILVVGMLVDGAIIVTEFADRKMSEGMPAYKAYVLASQRMASPIIASTLTTLAAFMPLLFWPGIVGEFMKFLPITLIVTLSASLFMALIFVPTIGCLVGKPSVNHDAVLSQLAAAGHGNLESLTGFTGLYIRILSKLLKRPGLIFLITCGLMFVVYGAYGYFGRGVEFFPKVEPEQVAIHMRSRGDLSVYEMDKLLKEGEDHILKVDEFATVYARSGASLEGIKDATEDTHGVVLVEFVDWKKRRKASQILVDVQDHLDSIPGVIFESRQERAGPAVGKPIRVELASRYSDLLLPAIEKLKAKLLSMEGLKDIDDSRPVPGIEWRIMVDRAEASRFGANMQLVGDVVQLITDGYKLDGYRPEDADDEVDIRARFASKDRALSQIDSLKVSTEKGQVCLSSFLSYSPAPKLGKIDRSEGRRVYNVRADVKPGVLVDSKVREIARWIQQEAGFDSRIDVTFKGEDEEQQKSKTFLMGAFLIALAVMGIILVTQFNSFYDAFLILTAVVFSTIGVFLGLLITDQAFSIVMNGIGVIALAGIVVNNNIVLIDTFLRIKTPETPIMEAVLRTCAQRFRPVMLTTITTVLGLLPMVFGVNIDFINRITTVGAPSTQWWSQLSTSVAFGLTFATVLTLILTPALLVLGNRFNEYFKTRSLKA